MKQLNIEEVKKRGQVRELMSEIDDRIAKITYGTFEEYKDGGKYYGLKNCLSIVKTAVDDIEKLLDALNQIQSGHV